MSEKERNQKGRIAVNEKNTAIVNSDGTVDIVGYPYFVSSRNTDDWRDIVQVNLGENYVLGLKRDGTVVMTGSSSYQYVEKEIPNWQDIIAITSVKNGSCGIKSDGTVVTAGFVGGDKDEIKNWRDIVDISSSGFMTVGVSNGEEKLATATLSIPSDVEDAKEFVLDKAGLALANLNKVEAGISAALEEIKAERNAIAENINVSV